MPSQFFGLQIGYSGLTTYQAALNTTGNNIANVETKGYSRQQVNQQAANALRTHTTYGMAGAGTKVTSIDQVRNAYYDIKYWNTTASLGEYNIKSSYMAQVENYFNDDGDIVRGFASIMDDYYSSLEDLENNPGDTSTRTAFIGQARSLTEYFNSVSEELTSLQLNANDQVKNVVNQINSLASQIATINEQINIIELKGIIANELRDQRNNMIDELSQYVDVEITEDPIYSDKDNTIPSGAYRYIVTISGNATLVDGYDYRTLEVNARSENQKVNQSDADGLYDICWSDTKMRYYPIGNAYTGELKGLLQVRDGNNDENFQGTMSVGALGTTTVDGQARTTVKVEVSAEYLQDLTKSTINSTGVVKLSGREYNYSGWEAELDTAGKVLSYTFILAPDDEQMYNKLANLTAANTDGKAATIGTAVDYQGIPYFMQQMNEWIRNYAETFNDVMEEGSNLYGDTMCSSDGTTTVCAFFVAENVTDAEHQYNFKTQSVNNKSTTIKNTDDSYYQLTAATFRVNQNIIDDAGLMATTTLKGDINVESHDIVDKLEKIATDKSMMSFRGCSSGEFLNCVLGDVALNASSSNSFTKNFTNIQDVIKNQRLSESGVDDDEEALNLVKYQNAYNLSAKMIQTMTEIYDRLINSTGV